MNNTTREKFNKYLVRICQLNDVSDTQQTFNIKPSIQQKLETLMQESSEFLQKINVVGVTEQQGEKLGLGIGSPVASNTDTSNKDRQTKDPTKMDKTGYHCRKNNSDTHITYAKLDLWAKFKDFQTRIRDLITQRQALDRIIIGFNGEKYEKDTDSAANPLLQDVNIGWLQKYRNDAPERVMFEGKPGTGEIQVYSGGHYENLDALVFDAVNNLIAPWYREDTGLVAIVGRDLLADKYFPLVNQNQPATETMATEMIISQKRIGGLSAVRVPYLPAGTILITRLDNLSIYYQEGARRRHMEENPKRDRIENYESSNDAYVVEDYTLGCVIENIVLEKS
ncbi:MAG: phage major capsid protein, P2 family [Marinobacterium sp.]|nr:phage major capsid protein, P2 family [Marinobacterium sp.]